METRSFTTDDGAEIAYRIRPGRDPWVLLHGLGCDASMWDAVAALLDPAIGLVVPEFRGHGGSTIGWQLPSVDVWALDVSAILERERILRPAVAGFSMGGYATLAFAAAFPGRARGLALVSTSAAPDDDAGRLRRAAGLGLLQREGSKAFAEMLLPNLVLASRADFERNRSLLLEMFARAGSTGLADALHALANRADRRPLLPSLGVPVRVLVGDQDKLTPPDRSREIASAVPGARLTIVDGVAHMSAMEVPTEVATLLADI